MNLQLMRNIGLSLGISDALDLRARAGTMSGTEIIDEEFKVPEFKPEKDYSSWTAGAPVSDAGQVWQLIQPYNARHYTGRPADLRSLWSLCHTRNPEKAKFWVDPFGTSGAYLKGECYKSNDGKVYRAVKNNLVHDADSAPECWVLI